MKYKYIIWDYNGTLLDDAQLCVDCMNELLRKYNISEITYQKYKQIFDFPVKDYYQRAGFDFNKFDFNIVGVEFIDLYQKYNNQLKLQKNVIDVLENFKNQNIKQSILSAREHNKLIEELDFFGINHYFEKVLGLDNHLAAGKLDNGKILIEKINIEKSEIVLIGDTTHDFDVANELGIECILIASGHHSFEKLKSKNEIVLENLSDLLRF